MKRAELRKVTEKLLVSFEVAGAARIAAGSEGPTTEQMRDYDASLDKLGAALMEAVAALKWAPSD